MRKVTLLIASALISLRSIAAQAQPSSASLVAAESAASDASAKLGMRTALHAAFAVDAAMLYSGAPIIRGRENIDAFLSAQPTLDSITVRWQPIHVEMSRDNKLGAVWGVTITSRRHASEESPRLGKFISVWKSGVDNSWKLVALVQLGVVTPQSTAVPATTPALPTLTPKDPAAKLVEADVAFARLAAEKDPATAFRAFAADRANSFPASGLAMSGPDEIAESLTGSASQLWQWAPRAAGIAESGDLGYTIGEATVRPRSQPEAPASRSKYLTVWRVDANGTPRFVMDGGNARPAPQP